MLTVSIALCFRESWGQAPPVEVGEQFNSSLAILLVQTGHDSVTRRTGKGDGIVVGGDHL